ncbi:hypothetical protein NHX12_001769 [Muraenolepis orangiensis]|uniref:Gamma-aminobutyric acid type B receptor subunit 2 n=1 Tax=Muraenolepis orangiensis TaxID=630683 RepID=A0A9Q0IHJ9_9TELE|nr:hypothetical protein NHX12_001769 [Muraenolepis orangiensis]
MLVLTYLWVSPPCLAEAHISMPVLWVMPVATVTPEKQNVTAALAPALWLALEDLRRQGGSQIHLQLLDSRCDSATALKGLFDAMWEEPGHLIIFGGACPQVTAVLARSVHALHMVQLSFTAMSAELSDRRRYPSLFSMVPSDRAFNTALVQLLQHFSWTRVALLTQEGARLSQMKKNLFHQLMKADIQMTETQRVTEDPCLKLKKLKDSDVRIIVGQMEEGSASKVFCCAYRLNLFGPRYQWILSTGPDPVWRLDMEGSGCTQHALHSVLEGSIRLNLPPLSDTHIRGVSGRTPLEYEQAYLSEIHQEMTPDTYLHGYAYDGVWVMAKAVRHITERLKRRDGHSANPNLSITQERMADMLLDALKETQFEGVTGPVLFRNGERVASVELRQFQATRETLVGQYNTFTQKLQLFPDMLKFSGSGPAEDGTVVRVQRRNIGLVLYAVLTSAAALVFIATLTILFHSISDCICFWEPRGYGRPLDLLHLLGILLTLSWVPLAGLDGALVPIWVLEPLCSVRLWLLMLGHCMGFGVLFTRSLNIYTGKLVLDPLRRVEHVLESSAHVEKGSVRWFSDCCVSANTDLWLTAVYAYKAPLLGLGCFIACSMATRKDVTQEVARESRRLALSVCSVALTSGLGALGCLLSSNRPQLHFLLPSIAILTGTALPLLWGVRAAGPREAEPPVAPDKVSFRVPPAEHTPLQSSPESQEGRVQLLTSNNQQLRRRRTQLDDEIETITMEIDSTPLPDHQISDHSYTRGPVSKPHPASQSGLGSVQHSSCPSTVAQVSCQSFPKSSPGVEKLNSPEHVGRRLSIQLPILHHAYHPGIGGVATSCSSLLESHDTAGPLADSQV